MASRPHRSRRTGALLAVAATLVLAGCGGGAAGPTPSTPTLTPAPIPSESGAVAGAAGGTPTAAESAAVYAIGPQTPPCPSDVGEEGKDYPEVVTQRVTVEATWSNAAAAAQVAERAVTRAGLGPTDLAMRPVPGPPRAITLAGERFDPAARFDVDRYAVATTTGARTVDAVVLETEDGRTDVQVYALTGFC